MPKAKETFESWSKNSSSMRTWQNTRNGADALASTSAVKEKVHSAPEENPTPALEDNANTTLDEVNNTHPRGKSTVKKRCGQALVRHGPEGTVRTPKGMKHTPGVSQCSNVNEERQNCNNSFRKNSVIVEVGNSTAVVQEEEDQSPSDMPGKVGQPRKASGTPPTITMFSTQQGMLSSHEDVAGLLEIGIHHGFSYPVSSSTGFQWTDLYSMMSRDSRGQ
jgi:hypothetical protein